MAQPTQPKSLRACYTAHRNGSMFKGLLIWLALGGASFFIGFVLLARLIPTSRQQEMPLQYSHAASEPAQAAQAAPPSESQQNPVVVPHPQSSSPSPGSSNHSTRNMLLPSIDPAEKPVTAEPSVQKPEALDGASDQNNRNANDGTDRNSQSDNTSSPVDSPIKLDPPRKPKHRRHRKTTHEAVQNPTSIDNSSEPIPAAPSIEPGGDTTVPPPKLD